VTILVLVFFGMALYGALTGHLGGALLALFMAGFTIWGQTVMRKQDERWAADPRNAQRVKGSTSDDLETYECECTRDHL